MFSTRCLGCLPIISAGFFIYYKGIGLDKSENLIYNYT